MKGERLLLAGLLLTLSIGAGAWDYSSTQNEDKHVAQLRVEASYGKKWKNGLALHIGEELRFDMVSNVTTETAKETTSSLIGPRFNKSYTTLSLSYKHPRFSYLKGDLGYALKLTNKDTLDVKEFMRHRVFAGLTGSYRHENWAFSLRERVLTEIRMDDLDQHTATGYYEDNRANWWLRSRLEVAYHAVSKPLKTYLWCEAPTPPAFPTNGAASRVNRRSRATRPLQCRISLTSSSFISSRARPTNTSTRPLLCAAPSSRK